MLSADNVMWSIEPGRITGIAVAEYTGDNPVQPRIPLYYCSLVYRFEYIVTLEGVVEPSGNTTQARTSYLVLHCVLYTCTVNCSVQPSEIVWGHQFASCVHWDPKQVSYSSLSHFQTTQTEKDQNIISLFTKYLKMFVKKKDKLKSRQ